MPVVDPSKFCALLEKLCLRQWLFQTFDKLSYLFLRLKGRLKELQLDLQAMAIISAQVLFLKLRFQMIVVFQASWMEV